MQLMKNIYTDAELMVAWLASDNEHVNIAFDTINMMAKEITALGDKPSLHSSSASSAAMPKSPSRLHYDSGYVHSRAVAQDASPSYARRSRSRAMTLVVGS